MRSIRYVQFTVTSIWRKYIVKCVRSCIFLNISIIHTYYILNHLFYCLVMVFNAETFSVH